MKNTEVVTASFVMGLSNGNPTDVGTEDYGCGVAQTVALPSPIFLVQWCTS